MDKNHEDPITIALNAPRHAQYMHKAWKKHQNQKFYQTRSNAIILHETLPADCIPKVVRMESGEVIYEKIYAPPRPPSKISLKHDWMKELGPEICCLTTRGTSCSTVVKFPFKPTTSKPRS